MCSSIGQKRWHQFLPLEVQGSTRRGSSKSSRVRPQRKRKVAMVGKKPSAECISLAGSWQYFRKALSPVLGDTLISPALLGVIYCISSTWNLTVLHIISSLYLANLALVLRLNSARVIPGPTVMHCKVQVPKYRRPDLGLNYGAPPHIVCT